MGSALMRSASQAAADTSISMHHHGVVVDFPAPHVASAPPTAGAPAAPPDAPIALSPMGPGEARNFHLDHAISAQVQRPSRPGPESDPFRLSSVQNQPGLLHAQASPERGLNSAQVRVNAPPVPMTEPIRPKKSWLDRWLHPEPPDKRKVRRVPTPGLVAHFWTGGPPQAQNVRDISASGLYVITEERWYLGTIITLTLTREFGAGPERERSITMQATAVRHGKDGVGLKFVLDDARDPRLRQPLLREGGNGEQLEQFLQGFESD
jgi:hypothetical protein